MKRLRSDYCLVEISRDNETLKDLIQLSSLEIEPPWRRFHLTFSSRDTKLPSHDDARQRVVVKRSEKWSSSLFSRARSRSLALPLFRFSVAAAVSRAHWNQVLPRGYLSPWQRIVSKQRAFRQLGAFPCIAQGPRANVSARRCVLVVRRCAARHYPHDF